MLKKFIASLLLLIYVGIADAQKPSSGGSSFKSGGSSGSSFSPSKPSSSSSSKPSSSSSFRVDRGGTSSQQKQASTTSFKKAEGYKDPKTGLTKSYTQNDHKRIEVARAKTTPEKQVNRPERIQHHYHNYYNQPAPYYSDPFGPFFYLWLLDQSLDERANWAYHQPGPNGEGMDKERYQDMLAKDAQLEARIKQLEAEKVSKDPNYIPKDLFEDPDLMYSDQYLHDALQEDEDNFWENLAYLIGIIVVIGAVLFLLVWLREAY